MQLQRKSTKFFVVQQIAFALSEVHGSHAASLVKTELAKLSLWRLFGFFLRSRVSIVYFARRFQLGVYRYGLQEELPLANLMREHGVRRSNVFKNTGGFSYNFNAIQARSLPASFRPPTSTLTTVTTK
eukprot:m.83575 g.83575  ORF g.83575 m.83575 type:complete len:128 (+) comp12928_c0_seq2:2966-3349(+)